MANLQLYEALTRQQVYLEGVKDYYAAQFSRDMAALSTQLRAMLAGLEYDNLGSLTKVQLTKLLGTLRGTLNKVYDPFIDGMMLYLREFITAQAEIAREILDETAEDPVKTTFKEQRSFPIFGWLALSTLGRKRLQIIVLNIPVAATGAAPQASLLRAKTAALQIISNELVRAYADSSKTSEVLKTLLGTKEANYTDGVVNRLFNQGATQVNTVIQHVAQQVNAGYMSAYYAQYQWISVLDDRTTYICRGRAYNIYYFKSKGPFPPAHHNCRSHIIPYTSDAFVHPDDNNFLKWLKRQPKNVQDDIVGEKAGNDLRSGRRTDTKYRRFDSKPITIKQYRSKVRLMLESTS